METATRRTSNPASNPDPITKSPGAHPVGAGVGAAVGGAAGIGGAVAAGAAIGSAAGPLGIAAGAAIGGIAGGLVGKGVAEGINPTTEDEYWREAYLTRPYVNPGTDYDEYAPAYQYGRESRRRYLTEQFEEVESTLSRDWDENRGKSKLKWDQARHAVRDGFERVPFSGEGTTRSAGSRDASDRAGSNDSDREQVS
jgi:hypothetical protein